MGEFAESISGIKEACEFLDYPVVSGNVSFYNGTNKKNIYPTPVIGGVGLISNINNRMNHSFKKKNSHVLLIGKTFGHLHQSIFFEEIYSIKEGPPPEVNLLNEKNNSLSVLKLINNKLVLSAHDVSAGGIIVALAEMSMGHNFGIKIEKPKTLSNIFEYFYGEDQGRYIIEVEKSKLKEVKHVLKENNIFNEKIGVTQEEYFELSDELKMPINELYKINNTWYYKY